MKIENWSLKIPRVSEVGFTLVELLVALGILSIIITAVATYLNPVKQISKARDSKRSLELDQIKKALDIYYNDNGCYPATVPFGQRWANTTGRTIYMERVPDDTNHGYEYFAQPPLAGGGAGCPQWYTLFAQLDLKPDNQLTACSLDANAGANCVPRDYGRTDPTTGRPLDPFYTCKTSSSADCSVGTISGGGGSSLPLTCYRDSDGDGLAPLGASSIILAVGIRACPKTTPPSAANYTKTAPSVAVNTSYDCDDTTNTVKTPKAYYRDGDTDGYIDLNNTIYACSAPSGYIPSARPDCNDGNANQYANVPEYSTTPPVCDLANISKYKCTYYENDGFTPGEPADAGYSYTRSGINKLCTPSETNGTFVMACVNASTNTCSPQFEACSTAPGITMCPQAGSPVANVSKCVNTKTDNNNCGTCGNACGSGAACFNGSCVCANSSLTSCGGACVDLQTSNTNCGACGNPCTAVGAVCSSGACVNPRRVFATSTTYTGNLGGIAGADAKCQERADRAGLDGGKWRAWISGDKISAKNRLRHFNVAYKLLDGTTIANNWTDLTDGTLQNPINRSELGESVVSSSFVFTGTTVNGSYGLPNCNNFFSSDAAGGNIPIGDALRIDGRWTNLIAVGGVVCGSLYRLYCFEDLPAFSPDTNNSLENNLAGYWKMEEAPGTFIDSIGTRRITNTSIESSPGFIGNAGLFNGSNSYGQFSTIINREITYPQTFQAWFKGTDSGEGSNNALVKNPIFGTTNGLTFLSLGVDSGGISFASNYGGMGKIGGERRVADGNWHHLVWVNNSGRLLMYVDGVSDGGRNILESGITFFRFDYIGVAGSTNVRAYLNGSIDELAYWTKALTQQEITDLYNSGRGNTYKGGQ